MINTFIPVNAILINDTMWSISYIAVIIYTKSKVCERFRCEHGGQVNTPWLWLLSIVLAGLSTLYLCYLLAGRFTALTSPDFSDTTLGYFLLWKAAGTWNAPRQNWWKRGVTAECESYVMETEQNGSRRGSAACRSSVCKSLCLTDLFQSLSRQSASAANAVSTTARSEQADL